MTDLINELDQKNAEMSRFNDVGPCINKAITTLVESSKHYEAAELPVLLDFAKGVGENNQCLAHLLEVVNGTLAHFVYRDYFFRLTIEKLEKQVIGLNGSKGRAYDATSDDKTENDSVLSLEDPDLLKEMSDAIARYLGKSSLSETDFQDELKLGIPARNVVNICLAISIIIGVMKRVRLSDLPEALIKKIKKLALDMSADVNTTDSAFDDIVSPALGSNNARNATCDIAGDLMKALEKVKTNEHIRDAFNAEAKAPTLSGGTAADDGTVAYTTDKASKDKAQKQLRITFSILLANHIEDAVFEEHLVYSGINRFSLLPAILRCSPVKIHEEAGPLIWKSHNSKAYVFALPGSKELEKFKIESLCNNLRELVHGSTTESKESHFLSKLFLLKKPDVALVSRHHALYGSPPGM